MQNSSEEQERSFGEVWSEVIVTENQSYRDGPEVSAEMAAACRLDLYVPVDPGAGFPSILWLHGGGLTGGSRTADGGPGLGRLLARAGIGVAIADYRLNPAVTFPAYVEDAAAAWSWLRQHIPARGGDPARVFIGGHSAGGYLALMVALDARYLAGGGAEISDLAGVVALSAQTATHFTVRVERGFPTGQIVVDDAAPLFHATRRDFPFLLLHAGDDMPMRGEEHRLLASALRHAGCALVADGCHDDRDHSTIVSRMDRPGDAVATDVIRFLQASPRG